MRDIRTWRWLLMPILTRDFNFLERGWALSVGAFAVLQAAWMCEVMNAFIKHLLSQQAISLLSN